MFGADVHLLRVMLQQTSSSITTIVFQKEGDYGDNWNYGQVLLNVSEETTVSYSRGWAGQRMHPSADR